MEWGGLRVMAGSSVGRRGLLNVVWSKYRWWDIGGILYERVVCYGWMDGWVGG